MASARWGICCLAVLAACSVADEPAPASRSLPTWRVEETSALTIGNVDGAEEYLLTNTLQGVLLGDGTLVLRNSGRNLFELRYFDSSGRHLATVSRFGQGPFEFTTNALFLARLPGDSVLVVGDDWRYAVFGARGERVRDGRIPGSIPFGLEHDLIDPAHIGVGSVVLESRVTGPQRAREALIVRTFDGASDTVAVLNAARVHLQDDGRPYLLRSTAPFTPEAFAAAGPGVFWFGSTDLPEVYGYRTDGRGMDTIRLGWGRSPVTGADRDAWIDQPRPSEQRRESDVRAADLLGFPDSLPYWSGLQVDRAGNVWVLRYEVEWADGPQLWNVFSPAGEPVATVAIPRAIAPRCTSIGCLDPRSGLLDISEDYLLMNRLGAFNVRQVHLHRLIKE